MLTEALLIATALAAPLDSLTPGLARTDMTAEQIRTHVWGHDQRLVTPKMRSDVAKRDGVSGDHDQSCHGTCELDHRIPRSCGGADDERNLWYQASPWWHLKDRVEDAAAKDFKAGRLSLQECQAIFLGDWRVEFRKRFGALPGDPK